MIRLGMTLGIKEEKIEEYKKLHANAVSYTHLTLPTTHDV